MHRRLFAFVFLASPALAQVGLAMEGGSLPGAVSARLGPYRPGTPAAVILSVTTGPTPLSLLDVRDIRVLDVGVESLGISFFGVIGFDGFFPTPSIPVANLPWFVDRALFFQGMTLEGSAVNFLVGEISDPRAVRFAPAFAFRSRAGTPMSQARAFFDRAIPIVAGRWIVAAGGSGALLSQAALHSSDIYDPRIDAFFAGPSLNIARSVHTVTELSDGKWLLAAGVDTNNDPQNTAEVFDPTTLTFRNVANPMRAQRMGHTANLLPDGRVFVTGGLSDLNSTSTPIDPVNSALASTEFYDPVTDTWTPGPNMSRPRAGHAAIPLPDGRILYVGGVGYTTVIIRIPQIWTQAEIFNPATNTFSGASSMQTPRALFSVADLGNGRFLVAGGISSLLSLGTPTASAEIYNSNTGTWSPTGSMRAARGMAAAAPFGAGRFLFFGGADGTLLAPNALATSEIYDVAAGTFSSGPTMNVTRAAFGAFVTPTGQVHTIGGGTGQTGTSTGTSEWLYR